MEEGKKRRSRRQFSEEFKREAVELAKKIGLSKASRELDVHEATIHSWRRKLELGEGKEKTYAELEKEVRRLKKENSYLLEINRV
ncbi:MAG: hypothetical protein D6797_01420 [Bdellovibrio sp.]|nr:MAG: hypothetical protein D6797_01420 [Bdellovibrio sp.]